MMLFKVKQKHIRITPVSQLLWTKPIADKSLTITIKGNQYDCCKSVMAWLAAVTRRESIFLVNLIDSSHI